MDMNGSQRIEADRETVYAALNDVDVLRRCIPGCESIEKTSDTAMNAKVTLKVGPVKASFSGSVTLSDLDPPNGYTIAGQGTGGIAGFAKGQAKVRLEADGVVTILHYDVKVEIGGKLAQLGSRLIDSTAMKLAGSFFDEFGKIVAAPAEVAQEAPAEKSKGWLKQFLTASPVILLLAGSGGLACCASESHADTTFMPDAAICGSGHAPVAASRTFI
jgi:carbon monoxide dehydrogenase subunit G